MDLLRWHGCKSTFTSIMQHLNVPRHTVRFAGDWAAKEDAMPDVYMREAQIMVLRAQERVISYLRAGGDLFRLRGEKIGSEQQGADAEARKADDAAKVEKAMAEPELFDFDGESLARELLDSAFGADGKISMEVVAEESRPEDLESKARELLTDMDETPETAKPGKDDEAEVRVSEAEPGVGAELAVAVEKVQEALDESDTEGLTSCLVQLVTPSQRSKLHLPLEDYMQKENPGVVLPKCGARGKYEIVKADDALDAHQELCWRCCPAICKEKACTRLCEYIALGRGTAVIMRCVRRCALGPEGSDSHTHKCLVHSA